MTRWPDERIRNLYIMRLLFSLGTGLALGRMIYEWHTQLDYFWLTVSEVAECMVFVGFAWLFMIATARIRQIDDSRRREIEERVEKLEKKESDDGH